MIQGIKEVIKLALTFDFKALFQNRFFRICLIGFSSFLVQAVFFEIFGLRLAVFRPALAATLGAELAIINSFSWHNFLTFRDRRISASAALFKKFFQFNSLVAMSLIIQWFTVSLGEVFSGGNLMVLRGFNVLGVIIGFIWNYFSYTKIIWPENK